MNGLDLFFFGSFCIGIGAALAWCVYDGIPAIAELRARRKPREPL